MGSLRGNFCRPTRRKPLGAFALRGHLEIRLRWDVRMVFCWHWPVRMGIRNHSRCAPLFPQTTRLSHSRLRHPPRGLRQSSGPLSYTIGRIGAPTLRQERRKASISRSTLGHTNSSGQLCGEMIDKCSRPRSQNNGGLACGVVVRILVKNA